MIDSDDTTAEYIFKYIGENDAVALERFLKQNNSMIDVTQVKESRVYTALSFAAFKNHANCFKAIYQHAITHNLAGGDVAFKAATSEVKKGELTSLRRRQLALWIDTPTDERFTALHFATYHGNIELVRLMVEEMRANFLLKNVYGANVLHVAA